MDDGAHDHKTDSGELKSVMHLSKQINRRKYSYEKENICNEKTPSEDGEDDATDAVK